MTSRSTLMWGNFSANGGRRLSKACFSAEARSPSRMVTGAADAGAPSPPEGAPGAQDARDSAPPPTASSQRRVARRGWGRLRDVSPLALMDPMLVPLIALCLAFLPVWAGRRIPDGDRIRGGYLSIEGGHRMIADETVPPDVRW